MRPPGAVAFELSGHRGARALWPENTLAGFAGALALGVDALELDVCLSADGVPVVIHDLTLNPDLVREPGGAWLAKPGQNVRSLDLAALRRFDVGRARPGSPTATAHPRQQAADGARIPTLAEVFRLAHGVRLDVELKTDPQRPAISPDPEELTGRVLAVADAADAAGTASLALRAFDWRGLRHAARLRPALPLAFLTEGADLAAVLAETEGRRDCAWAPHFDALTPAMIAAAQAAGLAVKPWTVNEPEAMARLIGWGVDGFCTDAPDVARRVMRAAGLALPPSLAAA